MNTTGTSQRGCGCGQVSASSIGSWSAPLAKTKNCGCDGSGSGMCGCGQGSTIASGAGCSSGTGEASTRPGVVVDSCMPPRPRFFPGQLVTDADLSAGVAYQRAQQLLANSVLSGWGVYCGFALCIDEKTCTVCVGPGVAIDAKGRELVSNQSICIPRPTPSDVDGREQCDPCAKQLDEKLWLALVYDDCLDAAKPRYGSVCGASVDPGCDFSRVRERARFVWLRSLDSGYWTSGCLADPCGDPVEVDPTCADPYGSGFLAPGGGIKNPIGKEVAPPPPPPTPQPTPQPLPVTPDLRLDQCTPCIGIRGGRGVSQYARALDAKWALSKNASIVSETAKTSLNECGIGAATIIDVISGAACELCPGEAVVVIAGVEWSTKNGKPALHVLPARRRVLSNASLTYLVEWLLERELCGPRTTVKAQKEEAPPVDSGTCADPCVDDETLILQVAEAAVGREEAQAAQILARSKAAYYVTIGRKRTLESFDSATVLDVLQTAIAKPTPEQERAALQRFGQLAGRAAFQDAIDRGVGLLFPKGVPEGKKIVVEREVFEFIKKRNFQELGTAPFKDVIELANTISEKNLGRSTYPKRDVERLAKIFPDAGAATEIDALQAQVRKLQKELAEIEELARGKLGTAAPHEEGRTPDETEGEVEGNHDEDGKPGADPRKPGKRR